MRIRALTVAAIAVLATVALASPVAAQEPFSIAIVAHPTVAAEDLSFLELRKIFLGERQFWRDNQRIVLLVRSPVAQERDIVLKKIYRMEEAEFKQYWIAKVFRAEVSSKPKTVVSSDMTRELVAALPGAIGFLPSDQVGPSMKVLRINGKLPGEPGYSLQ